MNKIYQRFSNQLFGKPLQQLNDRLQSQVLNNPRLKEAIDLVKQNGGNAEQVFYQLAKQKGINPQEVLNMINRPI